MHNNRYIVKKYLAGIYKNTPVVIHTNPQLNFSNNGGYGVYSNNINLNLGIITNDIVETCWNLKILKYEDFHVYVPNKNITDNAVFDSEKDVISSISNSRYSYLLGVDYIGSTMEYLTIIPIYTELTDIKQIRKHKLSRIL